MFPELEVDPIYDGDGDLAGWEARVWQRALDPEVADLPWPGIGAPDLRDRFADRHLVASTRAARAQIIGLLRDARGPLHRASAPGASPVRHHAEFGDEYFQHWRRYGNVAADVLETRPVGRDEFDRFAVEFTEAYQRLQQYISLMWELYSREVQCSGGSPVHEWTCGDLRARFSSDYGTVATTFQVYPSEIFWAHGVDPWAYMEEIAATSRPTPLGARPEERITLRFVADAGVAGEPEAAALVHGRPFRVEAAFAEAPGQAVETVDLEWPGGERLAVAVRRTADPAVYRSEPLVLVPAASAADAP